ncbi:hypothetical protein ACHWQZ_G008693 [Mnemiopsis leidyi]
MTSTQHPHQQVPSSNNSSHQSSERSTSPGSDSPATCQNFLNWKCPHGISGKKDSWECLPPHSSQSVQSIPFVWIYWQKRLSERKRNRNGPAIDSRKMKQKPKFSKQNTEATLNSADFLELRSLVTGMAAKLEALEKKIGQSAPSPSYPPLTQTVGPMIYPAPHMLNPGLLEKAKSSYLGEVTFRALDFNRADFEKLNEKLSAVNWEGLRDSTTFEDFPAEFTRKVQDICLENVPRKKPPTGKPKIYNSLRRKKSRLNIRLLAAKCANDLARVQKLENEIGLISFEIKEAIVKHLDES